MRTQSTPVVAVSREDILEGVNFKYQNGTYRADLKHPDEKGMFFAKLTNKGREMLGDWIQFQQKQ